MAMPFGVSITDFQVVGQMAWKLYESCISAPEVFANIGKELQSLHCVLEEAADTHLGQPLPPKRQARLRTILDGCISVLGDLQFIVQRYQTLGTDEKSNWQQLRLGSEDIAEIRSRLTMNITLLTAFRSYVMDPALYDAQESRRNDHGSWQWVVELAAPEGVASPRESIATSASSNSMGRSDTTATSLGDVLEETASLPPPLKVKSRVRLGSLGTGFSSRKKRLISAINSKNSSKAFEILKDEPNKDAIDRDSLDHALWSAVQFPSLPLMEALVGRGAYIDAVRDKKNILWKAVSAENEDAVRFLLNRKVDLKFGHLSHAALPLRAALKSDAIMTLLVKNGAPVNAEYQVSASMHLNVLQEAILKGRDNIVRILLNNGADVDACSSTHGTALMFALSIGRESLAKLLVQKGANVNITRQASATCPYTNTIEAAIIGRKPSLLDLSFRAGAVGDMPQALKFAQANSDYPLIPNAGSQYGNDNDGTRRFFMIMTMLAQRDLRYVCFFRKGDSLEAKRDGIRNMMNELCAQK